jgi:hypothetical protein
VAGDAGLVGESAEFEDLVFLAPGGNDKKGEEKELDESLH